MEIAVIDLPHISNFTDFDAFRMESDVRLRIVRSAAGLNGPDAVIIPGSKNTLGDLDYLRRSGLAERIAALARRGHGGDRRHLRRAADARPRNPRPAGHRIGGGEFRAAWGCLRAPSTVMAAEKTLVRTTARHVTSGLDVTGYEIHHGQTDYAGCDAAADSRRRPGGGHRRRRPAGLGHLSARRLRCRRLPPLVHRSASACGAGCRPWERSIGRYDIEPALDRLAEVVRASVRMDEIYRLMGLR